MNERILTIQNLLMNVWSLKLNMHFDDFYQTIGEFGRYQQVKYFLICCTYMITPIFVYTWTFTAATPSFTCRLPASLDNHSLSRIQTPTADQCRRYKSTISVHECQRCYQTSQSNGLESCQNFTFNRTFYQSTLVEEVRSSTFLSFCLEILDSTSIAIVYFLCSGPWYVMEFGWKVWFKWYFSVVTWSVHLYLVFYLTGKRSIIDVMQTHHPSKTLD